MAPQRSAQKIAQATLVVLLLIAVLQKSLRLIQWPMTIVLVRYVILPYLIHRRHFRRPGTRVGTVHRQLTILAICCQAVGHLAARDSIGWGRTLAEALPLSVTPPFTVYAQALRASSVLRQCTRRLVDQDGRFSTFLEVWETLDRYIGRSGGLIVRRNHLTLTAKKTDDENRPHAPSCGQVF